MANVSSTLLRALESECAEDLCQIIEGKEQEDFEALQTLLSLDASVDPKHRAKAIYALGRWGDPAPVAAIRSILPQLDEMERIGAIDALGRLGTEEALAGLLEHVNDASFHVRKFVMHGLGKINTPEAQDRLREVEAQDPVDDIRALAGKYLRRD